ncbi:MAG: hypothetical protein SGBAC_003897 [Bacillariaceae sp.]
MGAPMLGPSGGQLAAETCRAGGLGFLAAGHLNSKEALHTLEREIEIFKEVSNDEEFPLCIGFIGHSTFSTDQGWSLFENVLEDYSPTAIQVFAPAITYMKNNGTKTSVVQLAHSYGCKVIAQVGCEDDGVQALKEGVDCVIAQGTEAGGHGVRREHGCGTLSLTSRLVKLSKGKTPVLAAGGIVDGSGLMAALSLGADGVVLGTRLWASNEAKGPSAYKDAMIAAKSADQVVRTEAFDVIWNAYRGTKWPAPFDSSGVLRNALTDTWDEKISDLKKEVERGEISKVVQEFKNLSAAHDTDFSCVFSGKGVASIDSIEPAFDIISNIEKEAIESLQRVNMVAQAV